MVRCCQYWPFSAAVLVLPRATALGIRAPQGEAPAWFGRGHQKRAVTSIRAGTAQHRMVRETPALWDVKTHTLNASGAGPAGRPQPSGLNQSSGIGGKRSSPITAIGTKD